MSEINHYEELRKLSPVGKVGYVAGVLIVKLGAACFFGALLLFGYNLFASNDVPYTFVNIAFTGLGFLFVGRLAGMAAAFTTD